MGRRREGERVSGVIESVAQWPYNNNNLLRIAPFFCQPTLKWTLIRDNADSAAPAVERVSTQVSTRL